MRLGFCRLGFDELRIASDASSCRGLATSLGLSSAFAYPPQCAQRAVRDRAPIGELFDALWADRSAAMGFEPSAECEGNIGKLSLGVLVRSE